MSVNGTQGREWSEMAGDEDTDHALGNTKSMNDSEPDSQNRFATCPECGNTYSSFRGMCNHYRNEYGGKPKGLMLQALQEFAEELGRTPTTNEMDDEGPITSTPFQNAFGSWESAVEEAELEPVERTSNLPVQDKEFVCDGCGEKYSQTGAYYSHLKACTGETIERDREGMIEDIQNTFSETESVPTISSHNVHGSFNPGVIAKEFGSWSDALCQSGFEPNREIDPASEEELLEDLENVADKAGRPPTIPLYEECGEYNSGEYHTKFGSWNDALREAGFPINQEWKRNPDDLLSAIRDLSSELGHAPDAREFKGMTPYTHEACATHFGSWNGAVREAGYEPNTRFMPPAESPEYYGPQWKEQRRKAIERDGNECFVCKIPGDAYEMFKGYELDVHHLTPIQTFGPFDGPKDPAYEEVNRLSNLITLCKSCHTSWEEWRRNR